MIWKPEIEITPKTLWGTGAGIVAIIVVIWSTAIIWTSTTDRISDLEATRRVRNVQIADIQDNVSTIKESVAANAATQKAMLSTLDKIQADQRMIFKSLMQERVTQREEMQNKRQFQRASY